MKLIFLKIYFTTFLPIYGINITEYPLKILISEKTQHEMNYFLNNEENSVATCTSSSPGIGTWEQTGAPLQMSWCTRAGRRS